MVIEVLEKCEHEGGEGLRLVRYKSDCSKTLIEAFIDYEDNFDSHNIIFSDDEFEGECQSSEVISVKLY